MTPISTKMRPVPVPSPVPLELPLAPGVNPNGNGDSSERVQIARGSGYSLLARVSMALSRGVGLVLISRALGTENFGDYSLLIAAFAISSSLGTLGLDQAYIYFTGSGRHASHQMVRNALWLAVGLGSIAGVCLLGATSLLRERIFDTTPPYAELATAIMLPTILHHNFLQGIVLGKSWFRYYSFVEMVKWLVHLGALAVLAAVGKLTIFTALLALYVPVAAAGFVHLGAVIWDQKLSVRKLLSGLPHLVQARESLSYGVRACLLHVTQVLHLRLDVYLVKYFTSASIVGQYALAINIADVILYVGRSVGLAVFARRTLDPRAGAGFTPAVTRIMLVVVGLIATFVLLVRGSLISTFFGAAYLACTTAIACRLPGIVAESMSIVVVSDFLGRARTRGALVINSLAVTAGLALNAALLPVGGIVAAASIFSFVSWCRVAALIRVHASSTGASPGDYVPVLNRFWRRNRVRLPAMEPVRPRTSDDFLRGD